MPLMLSLRHLLEAPTQGTSSQSAFRAFWCSILVGTCSSVSRKDKSRALVLADRSRSTCAGTCVWFSFQFQLQIMSCSGYLGQNRRRWFRWVLLHLPGPSFFPNGHLWSHVVQLKVYGHPVVRSHGAVPSGARQEVSRGGKVLWGAALGLREGPRPSRYCSMAKANVQAKRKLLVRLHTVCFSGSGLSQASNCEFNHVGNREELCSWIKTSG